MPKDFVKPVVDAIAARSQLKKVLAKQLEKLDRAKVDLQAEMNDLSDQRRLIFTLAQRYPEDQTEPDGEKAEVGTEIEDTGAESAESPVEQSSNGSLEAAGGAKPGLTERERLVAREIIENGLVATNGTLTVEQVEADMRAKGHDMAHVASPPTALGTILYHRRKAYLEGKAQNRLPLESEVGMTR